MSSPVALSTPKPPRTRSASRFLGAAAAGAGAPGAPVRTYARKKSEEAAAPVAAASHTASLPPPPLLTPLPETVLLQMAKVSEVPESARVQYQNKPLTLREAHFRTEVQHERLAHALKHKELLAARASEAEAKLALQQGAHEFLEERAKRVRAEDECAEERAKRVCLEQENQSMRARLTSEEEARAPSPPMVLGEAERARGRALVEEIEKQAEANRAQWEEDVLKERAGAAGAHAQCALLQDELKQEAGAQRILLEKIQALSARNKILEKALDEEQALREAETKRLKSTERERVEAERRAAALEAEAGVLAVRTSSANSALAEALSRPCFSDAPFTMHAARITTLVARHVEAIMGFSPRAPSVVPKATLRGHEILQSFLQERRPAHFWALVSEAMGLSQDLAKGLLPLFGDDMVPLTPEMLREYTALLQGVRMRALKALDFLGGQLAREDLALANTVQAHDTCTADQFLAVTHLSQLQDHMQQHLWEAVAWGGAALADTQCVAMCKDSQETPPENLAMHLVREGALQQNPNSFMDISAKMALALITQHGGNATIPEALAQSYVRAFGCVFKVEDAAKANPALAGTWRFQDIRRSAEKLEQVQKAQERVIASARALQFAQAVYAETGRMLEGMQRF